MIGIKHLSVRPGQSPAKAAQDITKYCQAERDAQKGTGYYSERGGAPSRWLGEGARRLGLDGPVDAKVFTELLQGHLPNGEDISERGGRQSSRRMATDLTISAPKSFSMLVACAPPEEKVALMRLWDEAVAEGLKVVEKEVIVARRGKGGIVAEHTGVMVAAVFTHEDARPVDGAADMDIHGHAIILNQTQRADGTWVARDLDFGQRNVLRMTADFATKAHLAKGLQERGYGVRQTKDGFEMADITDEQIKVFSRRKGQVDDALESQGLTRDSSTAAQRDAANMATRESKSQLSQIDQAWEWRSRLREAGVGIDKMIRAARDVLKRGPVAVADLSTDAVASATRHLGERESVFSKRMTRLEALKAGMGAVTLDTVDQAIADKAAGLIDVGGDKLTTREALYREQEILARAREGRGQVKAICTERDVQALIEKVEVGMDEGKRLSDGQREAIRLALTTTDRITAIVGVWGVGKTTGAVRPIVSQAKTHGFHVVGITPTTKARKELAGANPDELMTIAAWLQTKPQTRKDGAVIRDEKRLIVMDEAAMVSAADMDRVMQKLAAEGGHIVLVGDPQQLRAVSAGTPMQQMIETGAVAHVKISQVMRQTDARLREMAQVWGDGDAKGAVVIAQEYMRTVTVTEEDWNTAGKAVPEKVSAEGEKKTMAPREVRAAALSREAAATYLQLTAAQRDNTIMMTGTHILRRAVNGLVREGLRERGEIGAQEITIRALDKSDMTEEQMARPESYHGRDDLVVRLSERVDRARKDVDYRVVGVEKGRVILERLESPNRRRSWNPASAKNAQVYVARDMALAQGDVIAFRDNAGPKDTTERVDNGEIGKILHVDKSGVTVRMEDGRTIGLDPQKRHVIDHGWAVTVHASQGATRERALYVAESAAGQEAIAQLGGVACSREKSALTIITDDQAKLSAKLEKWAIHETAMAAAKAAAREVDLETLKDLRAEAQAELGQAGDLSKAREDAEWKRLEEEGAVEHRRDRENQERREREEGQEWEIER